MALIIDNIELWGAFEPHRLAIANALALAGRKCPDGEEWHVSVFQGPELPGGVMRVELVGVLARDKEMCWSDWTYVRRSDGLIAYTKTVIPLDGEAGAQDWITNIQEGVGRMLGAS